MPKPTEDGKTYAFKISPSKSSTRRLGGNREGGRHAPCHSPLADSRFGWPFGGRNIGTPLYRQCGGQDRGGVVGSGLRPGRGHPAKKDRRGLREGQLQDRGHPEDLGRLLRFLQGGAEEATHPGRAERLWPRFERDD